MGDGGAIIIFFLLAVSIIGWAIAGIVAGIKYIIKRIKLKQKI